MNKQIIAALAGAVLLLLGAASAIITNSAQAQSQNNSGTQGNSMVDDAGNETITAGNVTLQLHAQLDAAIVAAQNNDTLGVLTSLSQILQGLTEINNPAGNATE